jgi:hypothetical protein
MTDQYQMQPMSIVITIGMFGSILTGFYIHPIIAFLIFAFMANWLAICMIWEV